MGVDLLSHLFRGVQICRHNTRAGCWLTGQPVCKQSAQTHTHTNMVIASDVAVNRLDDHLPRAEASGHTTHGWRGGGDSTLLLRGHESSINGSVKVTPLPQRRQACVDRAGGKHIKKSFNVFLSVRHSAARLCPWFFHCFFFFLV